MSLFIAIILTLVFLFLSGLHIYWAIGGSWGSKAVLPTRNSQDQVIMPGTVPTLIVAAGLLLFALLTVLQVYPPSGQLPQWLEHTRYYGMRIVSGIFFLRAIGDFRYVGFFKKYTHTDFGKRDTRLYSPLCLLIGIAALLLALL